MKVLKAFLLIIVLLPLLCYFTFLEMEYGYKAWIIWFGALLVIGYLSAAFIEWRKRSNLSKTMALKDILELLPAHSIRASDGAYAFFYNDEEYIILENTDTILYNRDQSLIVLPQKYAFATHLIQHPEEWPDGITYKLFEDDGTKFIRILLSIEIQYTPSGPEYLRAYLEMTHKLIDDLIRRMASFKSDYPYVSHWVSEH